jgi:hypothetical protein
MKRDGESHRAFFMLCCGWAMKWRAFLKLAAG